MKALAALVATVASLHGQAGPARERADPAAAARGRAVYIQYCINCHGSQAEGTAQGSDLVRSLIVLRDEKGNLIAASLRNLANHKRDLTQEQIADLAQFLRQRIEQTSKNRNASVPPNVLTGNAADGKAFFGSRCSGCHSTTGDLAGVATRYRPDDLQQRVLFPRRQPIAVTVQAPGAAPVSGTLVRIDDFDVSLRDSAGEYHSWRRTSGLEVVLKDPLERHHELLDEITDADIHNVVAYLETLK
jgi:mono/diheme cytochrome c family protein